MNRLGLKFFSSVLASVAAASLAACGGGSRSAPPVPAPVQTPAVVPSSQLVSATFVIKIPAPSTSSKGRKPLYISAATKSVRANMTADSAGVAITSQFNVLTQVTNGSGNSPGAPCTGSGPWTCTITMAVPPGSDTFTFTTYDDTTGTGTGASHILSQQIKTLTVVVGKANNPGTDANYNIVFDANALTMTINGTAICASGPVAPKFGVTGTGTYTFNVAYTDPAGKTIVAPGLPTLKVNGSTTSGVITGTGGNVNFNITGPQSFTLAGTTSAITDSTVTVNATAANSTGSSDGLGFTITQSFKFLTGTTPSNILAVAQGSQINLYNIAFGATDVITPNSAVSSLTATGSGSNVTVDLPNDLAFDGNKSLLVANGGSNIPPSDVGNLGCFPPGSLATSANAATTTPTNANDPFGIAIGSDGSVAVENGGGSSFPLSEYYLVGNGGNYVPESGGRATLTDGAFAATFQPPNKSIVALPTTGFWSAGTYALALTNASSQSKLVLWSPGGVETQFDFFDPATNGGVGMAGKINDPLALAYDSANSQIIAGDFNFPRDLHFYTASATPTQTAGFFTDGHKNTLMATSPDGHIAVVGVTGTGRPSAQVYDNVVPTRGTVGGQIFWGAAGPPADVAVVHSMFFINNSRLVIAVEDTTNTAISGVYIYDITDTSSGSPALKAFLSTAGAVPRSVAYLP